MTMFAVRALTSARGKMKVYQTAANDFQRDQELNLSHHHEFIIQLLTSRTAEGFGSSLKRSLVNETSLTTEFCVPHV